MRLSPVIKSILSVGSSTNSIANYKQSATTILPHNKPLLLHSRKHINTPGTTAGRRHSNDIIKRKMCGLIAAIDDVWDASQAGKSDNSDIPILQDKDVLDETCSKLYHRGPDGMQTSMGKFGTDTRWSMGHTRLAIVDPDNRNADMPFHLTFDDKTIHLAANGEIYNHEKVYHEMSSGSQYWPHPKISKSDCEVIGHAYAKYVDHDDTETYEDFVKRLDGMFAFVIMEEDKKTGDVKVFAARDSVGIKPLYYGKTKGSGAWMFSSELKALVGHVDPASVVAIPPGHYWTPQTGLVRYYKPEWLMHDDYEPWNDPDHEFHHVTGDDIREAFTKAIEKRMMADVDYGFFLSGGVDSCCVAHDLLPLYRAEREKRGDYRPIQTYTVGMANSPDVMAAKAMVEALGGSEYIEHNVREFTPGEVFDLIPKIIYHMETYEAELIRSSIPNWLLAERAAQDVKMVLTGEGADELFAGYLYFQDAQSPNQVQNELKRIYSMLGNINLHRTDRMTMAHGLEARVPFLDTEFTRMVMSVNPEKKVVDREAVKTNSRGREKTLLRELFEGPNGNGDHIPRPVLWRAKAMQCEGVGEDWVSILQKKIASMVSDEEMADAAKTYPINTPHTKEELYYRKIYDGHFHGMEHVVKLWEGGGRAMGAEWKSDMYTREGLKNTNMLSHALQEGNDDIPFDASEAVTGASATALKSMLSARQFSTSANTKLGFGLNRIRGGRTGSNENKSSTRLYASSTRLDYANTLVEDITTTKATPQTSLATQAAKEARAAATEFGFNDFEAWLASGCDDRSLILPSSGTNKYHIKPQPIDPTHIFRGSCTGNPPTQRGYDAAKALYEKQLSNKCISGDCDNEDVDEALRDIFDDQRNRIAKVLDLPEGTEVILCPSGSCAEYIPVAIAKALISRHPDLKEKTITNYVTQLREIGAGSAPAAEGKYFSTHAPLIGKIPDGRDSLAGFDGVKGVNLSARERCGSAVNAHEQIDDMISSCESYPIVHGVFGGKTGMRCDVMPPSLDGGDTSLGVVDACQGRFDLEELHEWLDQDSIVLFTGSKFYQAPPFCAAIIVPSTIAKKLKELPPPEPKEMFSVNSLGGFVTDKELSSCLNSWKPLLEKKNANNIGLALRWEAGLAGMEALSAIPDEKRTKAVDRWASSVCNMLEEESLLDAWCVERSIISIRVAKKSGGDSEWLSMSELRDLYRWMSMDVSNLVPDATAEERVALSKPAYIGQPVDVAESHGIVRIALGVESLLSYFGDKERTLSEDQLAVKKLAAIGKHFDVLKNSGV